MTPKKPKKMGQKAKRSTSKPRSSTRRVPAPEQVEPFARVDAVPSEPFIPELPVPPSVDAGVVADIGPEAHRDRAHRWSVTYPSRKALDEDTPSERRPGTLEEFHPAALEQFEAARQAAFRILDSWVVGDETREFVITISGHANKHHQPTNGQPNDRLSISIQQVGS